jgi:hypothetical protein
VCAFMQFPSVSDLTEYAVDVLKKLAAVSSQLNVGKVGDKVVSASILLYYLIFLVTCICFSGLFNNVLCCRCPTLRC